MKVYLVHHVDALSAEQDPQRHISPLGREQADRLGTRLKALGAAPVRILHSDKQWTIDTAERIAAKLGAADKTAKTAYPINISRKAPSSVSAATGRSTFSPKGRRRRLTTTARGPSKVAEDD